MFDNRELIFLLSIILVLMLNSILGYDLKKGEKASLNKRLSSGFTIGLMVAFMTAVLLRAANLIILNF